MRTFPFLVSGQETTTYFPETDEDYVRFEEWLARTPGVLALDSETTGLDIYSAGFAARLLQIGDSDTAWTVRLDQFALRVRETLRAQLASGRKFVCHNAPFDLLVLDRVDLAPLALTAPATFDTYVLAHILDPRTEADGGAGLGLKALSTVYVDPDAADTAKGLHEVFRREYKATKHTGWAKIDIDHPLFVTYAGLDVIYTARLLAVLGPRIRSMGLSKLAEFEHDVQRLTMRLQRRGLLVDVPYTQGLVAQLDDEAEKQRARAANYGVDNVNAPRQVVSALLGMGEEWAATTDSGAPSVSKEVLAVMADLDVREWTRLGRRDPNPLAEAVVRAKRAVKWNAAYASPFLADRDEHDRIHPRINSLAARTGRMSVSSPPLQQLPSGDWTIRRAIVADPGQVIVAADYRSMELRVLAALADVREMKRAIVDGRDLHDYTATLLYGPGFTKAQRKLAKGVGLGRVFGGGPTGLARQIGAPYEQVKAAVDDYNRVYPEVQAYGNRLQREARFGGGEIIMPSGRPMPLDRDRSYAATNYSVQGTARDLLAAALLRLDRAGLSEHLLLPVHDEVVCQAPRESATEVVQEIGRVMETTFRGVRIETDAEVYGESWGEGYSAPPRTSA